MLKTLLYLVGIGAVYYYYVEGKGRLASTNVGAGSPGFVSGQPSSQNPAIYPQGSRTDVGSAANQPWYSGPQISSQAESITTVVSNSFTGLKDLWALISKAHADSTSQMVAPAPVAQPLGASTAPSVLASAGQPVAAQVLVGAS